MKLGITTDCFGDMAADEMIIYDNSSCSPQSGSGWAARSAAHRSAEIDGQRIVDIKEARRV